jgi:hypothetical protein
MIIKFGHLDGDQNVVATFQQSRITFFSVQGPDWNH